MKLSLRSATSFYRFFSPVAGLGQVAALLLFSGLLLLPLTAEAGLPRSAVSIPTDQSLAAGLKAAQECEIPGKLMVLPALPFDFAGNGSSSSLFAEQALAVQSMPEGSEVWLHVVVGARSVAGNESEKQITERVDAFLKRCLSRPRHCAD